MRTDTIQQMGKHFGCLTVVSVIIGISYLAGAVLSLCFGTASWAIRGFKISAVFIGVPVVLWVILLGVVQRVRHPIKKEEQGEPIFPLPYSPQGEDVFYEIDADIEFDEDAPYAEGKYDAVLPVFSSFFVECEDGGKSVQEFIRFLVNVYGKGVVPYLTRFVTESEAADRLWNEKEGQQPPNPHFEIKRTSNEIRSDDERARNSSRDLDMNRDIAAFNKLVERGDMDGIKRMLMEHPELANVQGPDGWGYTPLHNAISHKKIQLANYLLDFGVDVNIRARCGETPLVTAAGEADVETCFLLIDKGAHPFGTTEDGETALHFAAFENLPELATKLLEIGAKRNAKNKDGETPLDWARQYNNPNVEKVLL